MSLDFPTTTVRKGADGAPSTARFRPDLARPGVLTEHQEGQQPIHHRRCLQPPRQRDVERRKLHLHGPAVASEGRGERGRLGPRCSAGPAGVRPSGAEEAVTAQDWARTGLGLGWEGAPGLRLGANKSRASGLGSSCGARSALADSPGRRGRSATLGTKVGKRGQLATCLSPATRVPAISLETRGSPPNPDRCSEIDYCAPGFNIRP